MSDHIPQPAPDERVETVARVLREHRKVSDMGGRGVWTITCGCGRKTGPLPSGEVDETHRAHQAAAVVAALDGETGQGEGRAVQVTLPADRSVRCEDPMPWCPAEEHGHIGGYIVPWFSAPEEPR